MGLTWVGIWFLTAMITSIIIGVRGDVTRREITHEHMAQWIQEHPAPPGTTIHGGTYPTFKNSDVYLHPRARRKPLTPEEEAQSEYYQRWSTVNAQAYQEAQAKEAEARRNDWLPICSYPANLERIGELTLGVEDAWITLGRALPPPEPMMAFGPPGRFRPPPPPVNERRLADQMVWLFPWYWSAAVLGGLALLSVLVLTRQVKSLDRLK